jgi:hypothetical protein
MDPLISSGLLGRLGIVSVKGRRGSWPAHVAGQVRGTRDEPLLTVMLAFGPRRGEALGLHWSALDRDAPLSPNPLS